MKFFDLLISNLYSLKNDCIRSTKFLISESEFAQIKNSTNMNSEFIVLHSNEIDKSKLKNFELVILIFFSDQFYF